MPPLSFDPTPSSSTSSSLPSLSASSVDISPPAYVRLAYRHSHTAVLLSASVISVSEASALISAVFDLQEQVVALYEPSRKIVFPFSLVISYPQEFTDVYQLVLEKQGIQPASQEALNQAHNTPAALTISTEFSPPHTQSNDQRLNSPFTSPYAQRPSSSSSSTSSKPRKRWNEASIPPNLPQLSGAPPFSSPAQPNFGFLLSDSELAELEELQRRCGFASVPPSTVFSLFRRAATSGGKMSRMTFASTFAQFLPLTGVESVSAATESSQILNRLFDLFDRNNDDSIDVREFLTGLTLLCAGDRDEKVSLAFDAYDQDGDGCITLPEMISYFRSFFTVCFDLSTSLAESALAAGTNAIALGDATARHCFDEADKNGDGKVTFEEFKEWYSAENNEYQLQNQSHREEEEEDIGEELEVVEAMSANQHSKRQPPSSSSPSSSSSSHIRSILRTQQPSHLLSSSSNKSSTRDDLLPSSSRGLLRSSISVGRRRADASEDERAAVEEQREEEDETEEADNEAIIKNTKKEAWSVDKNGEDEEFDADHHRDIRLRMLRVQEREAEFEKGRSISAKSREEDKKRKGEGSQSLYSPRRHLPSTQAEPIPRRFPNPTSAPTGQIPRRFSSASRPPSYEEDERLEEKEEEVIRLRHLVQLLLEEREHRPHRSATATSAFPFPASGRTQSSSYAQTPKVKAVSHTPSVPAALPVARSRTSLTPSTSSATANLMPSDTRRYRRRSIPYNAPLEDELGEEETEVLQGSKYSTENSGSPFIRSVNSGYTGYGRWGYGDNGGELHLASPLHSTEEARGTRPQTRRRAGEINRGGKKE